MLGFLLSLLALAPVQVDVLQACGFELQNKKLCCVAFFPDKTAAVMCTGDREPRLVLHGLRFRQIKVLLNQNKEARK